MNEWMLQAIRIAQWLPYWPANNSPLTAITLYVVEHTFDLQLIRGQPTFDPGTFWPNLKRFFWPELEKIEKYGIFWGNFPNPNQRWLTQPDPTQATKNWSNPGQNFLTWTHHYYVAILKFNLAVDVFHCSESELRK